MAKHILNYHQYITESNKPSFDTLDNRDAIKGFSNEDYKMVRFAFNDEGDNGTALLDLKNKKVISYSLTGSSERTNWEELNKK